MEASAFIEGTKRAPRRLGRVLVLGLGKSGRAAADYCLALLGGRVEELCVAAGARNPSAEDFAARAEARGARVAFGDDAVEGLGAHGRFDVCVKSPGIPPASPLFQAAVACCDEVISEVEFAWRESAAESRWVAVTGTNGKSTVTACTAQVLAGAGLAAAAVGNIGDTCLDAVAAGATDVYVVEVSSYQLASTVHFAPNVAVLLGITPDHVHWHGSLEAYAQAKLKVLENLPACPGAVAVMDATNDAVRAEVRRLRARPDDERGFACVPVGTAAGVRGDMRRACGAENAAFLGEDGALHVALGGREQVLCAADELQIAGDHNVLNALAAASAALALGLSAPDVAAGLRVFPPLEHRIEPCGQVRGVRCYNDSKATNVDAALKALAAFPGTPLVVLFGGDDKGTDLAPLVQATHACAHAAVCYGAAGPRFAAAFEAAAADAPRGFSVLRAEHLADAFAAGLDAARPGEVLLLSPACASFDEFGCFEERGRAFKALVGEAR